MTSPNLPNFSELTPAYFAQTLTRELSAAYAQQAQIGQSDQPASWDNTVLALEAATEPLGKTWGLANHLQSVCDTPELRACVNEFLPKMSEFSTQLGQDLKLLARYEALEKTSLNAEQTRVVAHALRDFVLSGAKLPPAQREAFAAQQAELAQLQQTFSEHVLDATNAFEHYVTDPAELAGLPDDELAARAAAAQAKGQSGYLITLHMPSYLPVMQYCSNRILRETLYRAYATRASELGEPKLDNTPLMSRIIALRAQQAALLGYASYAELSLATKMADNAQQVDDFLLDLAAKAKPGAQQDLSTLKTHAAQALGIDDMQAWDTAFVSEHLRQAAYAYSDHEVKQYFQEPKVFAGLFNVIETLFNVRFVPHEASTWHPSVRVFAVQTAGQTSGYLYVDAYAREGKRGGAWMNSLASRKLQADGSTQLPVALVVCNAAQPVGGKPALLSHDEVTTLFHEFGHALHHLLTQVNSLAISGIDGVEWDAVELPSQFMENYCWEWRVIEQLTAHTQTHATLPKALFDKMLAAKNFQAGLGMLRQVEFSLFDMRLHQGQAHQAQSAAQVLAQVRDQVAVNRPPEFNRFAHSFGHIFAGGYAAGYYSYKWAEVLSADAFAAFEESGDALNAKIGGQFRDQILAVGGSRAAMDSFMAFRGRKPQADALLRHNGLLAAGA